MLTATISDPEQLAIAREFQFSSAMSVPLNARGRTLGAIQLVAAESGRHYTDADLALAEDRAARAAIAVDNARLFRDAQQARATAERAAARTARLQAVTSALSNTLEPGETARAVVEQCLPALEGAYRGLVALVS